MATKPLRVVKPLRQTVDTVITRVRNINNEKETELLFQLWALERESIIARGKKTKDATVLSELEGYDNASSLISRWAGKKLSTEVSPAPAAATMHEEDLP